MATDSYLETTEGNVKASDIAQQAKQSDLNEIVVQVNEEKSGLNVFSVEKFPNSQSPAILTPSDSEIQAKDDNRLMKDIELSPVDQLEKVHNGVVTPQSETKI